MRTLLDLIKLAKQDIDIYRTPNLTYLTDSIEPILEALGQGSTEGHTIGSIIVWEDRVQFNTTFTLSGTGIGVLCYVFTIPIWIIEAADPVSTAREYMLRKAVADVMYEMHDVSTKLENLKTQCNTVCLELTQFLADTGRNVSPPEEMIRALTFEYNPIA